MEWRSSKSLLLVEKEHLEGIIVGAPYLNHGGNERADFLDRVCATAADILPVIGSDIVRLIVEF
jgi:hypothetical protein